LEVVTRFAPSPTGYLHIGGARTAIFNYLFAKKHNGKYLVRIEDTDQKRSTSEAVKAIHDGLDWLKINTSEKIVYQSSRLNSHTKIAYELLDKGYAYKCYLSNDELQDLRTKSRENGIPIKSPWRNKSINNSDKEFVIRLKMPSEGTTVINDLVQGEISVKNEILDDMVILRSDKTPTYMLSSVVDDYEMGVTHIIRGDDHLNNAFRQIQIIKYMNWKEPFYAHIPLIHGSDGSKLSKRHGATNVFEYHKMGYTSEAMFSYLLQLGWSSSNEDNYEYSKAVELFTLEKINKSPSKFDIKKLNNINSKFLNNMDINEVYDLVCKSFNLNLENIQKNRLKALLPELLKRVNVYTEIKDDIEWIVNEAFICKDKDQPKILKENLTILNEISLLLNSCSWTKDNINSTLKNYIINKNLKFKDIGYPLRLALTGKINSPDLASVIYELGCTIVTNRLNYQY
jgi:glutamyl-tRNA synthetase